MFYPNLCQIPLCRLCYLYNITLTCKLFPLQQLMVYLSVYVQRKVKIGTIPIPEFYLRNVRIPTLSANSGIVRDNSRIVQGIFYRFLLQPGLAQSMNVLDKVRIG